MPLPVPRKALNLKQKVDIIRFKDSNGGWSTSKLADKFAIGKTQVAEVLKNKENIVRRYNENSKNEKSRRFQRNGPGELIDKVVLEWFNCVRNKIVPVSGPIIQAKALEVANYSEALEQLNRQKEFYLNKGDEKGFSYKSELIIHHELETTNSKFKKQTSIESFFKK